MGLSSIFVGRSFYILFNGTEKYIHRKENRVWK